MQQSRLGEQEVRLADGLSVADALGQRERASAHLQSLLRQAERDVASRRGAHGLSGVPVLAAARRALDGAFEVDARALKLAAVHSKLTERVEDHRGGRGVLVNLHREFERAL